MILVMYTKLKLICLTLMMGGGRIVALNPFRAPLNMVQSLWSNKKDEPPITKLITDQARSLGWSTKILKSFIEYITQDLENVLSEKPESVFNKINTFDNKFDISNIDDRNKSYFMSLEYIVKNYDNMKDEEVQQYDQAIKKILQYRITSLGNVKRQLKHYNTLIEKEEKRQVVYDAQMKELWDLLIENARTKHIQRMATIPLQNQQT